MKSFNEYLEWGTKKMVDTYKKDTPGETKEGAEDPDIGDRKGSQPANYHKGLSKSTKLKRDAQFKKQAKMDDDDPNAYKPAPGDATAETKPSKHTKKYKKMFGEETEQLDEDATTKALKKKADKSGMPLGILRKVYNRGVAAWRTGHRPGTTPEQWGMARVNSFVTKSSGTWGKADKDLADKVRKEEVEQIDEAKGKLVKNMRVKNIHNGNKGTVVKGGDRAGGRVEVEWDDGKTTMAAGKYLEPIKESVELEEVAANSVAGGGVDMNPTGLQRNDKRRKYQCDNMFRRANGLKVIEKMLKAKKELGYK